MTLSVRERCVLEAIDRCSSTSVNALMVYFSELTADKGGMPDDEVKAVVASLILKGTVVSIPGKRSDVVSITSVGVLVLQEAAAS